MNFQFRVFLKNSYEGRNQVTSKALPVDVEHVQEIAEATEMLEGLANAKFLRFHTDSDEVAIIPADEIGIIIVFNQSELVAELTKLDV